MFGDCVKSVQIRSFSWSVFFCIQSEYRKIRIFFYCHSWKVSKYGVFSGPYFPAFGLNTERYSIRIRIQPECEKIRTRKNSVFGHFLRSENPTYLFNPLANLLLWTTKDGLRDFLKTTEGYFKKYNNSNLEFSTSSPNFLLELLYDVIH